MKQKKAIDILGKNEQEILVSLNFNLNDDLTLLSTKICSYICYKYNKPAVFMIDETKIDEEDKKLIKIEQTIYENIKKITI